jgi:hypothetical protein
MSRAVRSIVGAAVALMATAPLRATMHAQSAPAAAKPAKAATRSEGQNVGQRARKSASTSAACAPVDTTAAWYRRQRAWLDENSAKWSDDAFRTTLLATSGLSAASSNGAMLGYEIVDAVAAPITPADSAMIARLKALAAERGSIWPTKSVVGARGVLAVWALAARDTTLARVALKRMMEAGPDESPPAAVAILDDRQRLHVGRKQLHGTQLHRTAAGVLEPLPTEDEAHLALRRDGAELPSLATSLCAAKAAGSR